MTLRRSSPFLLIACWLAAAPPAGAGDPFGDALEACLRQLSQQPAARGVRLAEDCPEQAEVLGDANAPLLLESEAVPALTVERLRRAGELLEEPVSRRRYPLHRDELDSILRDLDFSREERETPWQRFARWFGEQFPALGDFRQEWLDRTLDSLFGHHRAFQWLGVALLLGLAGWVVWLVVRIVSPLVPGLTWRLGDIAPRSDGRPRPHPTTLATIQAQPVAGQPSALLRYCLEQLRQSGMLPPGRGLTNGECGVLLQQRTPELGTAFGRLCETVERSVYGGQALTREELATCYSAAARLTGEDTA
ncbi:MAG: DUF4129 domain-containing protein [Ectothiorhodospiraceae bacterium]|nr:DUF4129 domain-containing protein [Ectothiorhodospiraceae bacterium]MCH8506251.1 DUF4129 domain-containing protein [Ectothiorhodospiraceae bacterium]